MHSISKSIGHRLLRPLLTAFSFILLSVSPATTLAAIEKTYDLVIQGGRVIDPETQLDAVRNVAIIDGRIVAISSEPMSAATIIDAKGLVVAPGFIDLHSHTPTPLGQHYKVLDGVTTTLDLEYGAYPIRQYASMIRPQQSLINYGASAGYIPIRLRVKNQIVQPYLYDKMRRLNSDGSLSELASGIPAPTEFLTENASAKELGELKTLLEDGLNSGGLGIGLALDYISEAVNNQEMQMIFEVASRNSTPIFIHIRRGIAGDQAGLDEVIELAKASGAAVQICHLTHSAMGSTHRFLKAIRAARKEGVDITAEVLPYNAGTTTISAAVFSRDWQKIFDITYSDVEWVATGERLTEETWNAYRESEPNGMVAHHYLNDEWTDELIAAPDIIIVSDATPVISEAIGVPPQSIGVFARILGHYVREKGLLDLPTAISKMTYLPALRLESIASEFKHKGRIQVGADADITVFDPATVASKTSYQKPFQASVGFSHVIVSGELVLRDGDIQSGVFPGRHVYSDLADH